jgi:hypothetical protein
MSRLALLLLLSSALCQAQTPLEMPMLGAPLPRAKFELSNKIAPAKLARLPKELPLFKWSQQPRNFPVAAMQKLLDESAFAGTNVASLLRSPSNQNDDIKLTSRDNQDYFIVMTSAGRVAIQNTDRSREAPPGFFDSA